MFGSYRGIFAAIAGLIAISGGVGFGLFQQHRYEQDAQDRDTDYARYAAKQIKQSCATLPASEKPQCLANGNAEYQLKARDNQREYADLVAQKTSALWTGIMGIAALLGMLLSGVGVLLVWITFQETKRTNLIAMRENARSTRRTIASAADTERAFKVARKSADANAKLVKISADNSEKQLRAYLEFDSNVILRDETTDMPGWVSTGIKTFLKNYGHTPAKDVMVSMAYNFVAARGTFRLNPIVENVGAIPPQDEVIKNAWFHVPEALWQEMTEKTATLTVEYDVSYRDAFEKPHILRSHWVTYGIDSFGFVVGTRFSD